MFFCRLNVMQAQQRPTKRTKICNIVFHSDTFLNVFCPHLTLDYQDKNALKSTKRCKNLRKPTLKKTQLKVPNTSYNKITEKFFSNILESMIVRRYFCIGTNRYTKFSLTLKSLGKRKIQSVSYKKKLLNQCIAIFLCKLFLFFTFVRITLNFFVFKNLILFSLHWLYYEL